MTNEVANLAAYLKEVRRVVGEWPKALIVHPSADLEVVIAAIALAKETYDEQQDRPGPLRDS